MGANLEPYTRGRVQSMGFVFVLKNSALSVRVRVVGWTSVWRVGVRGDRPGAGMLEYGGGHTTLPLTL